jgi:glycosyltransferase involved in cell wall biosynthesis
VRLAICIITFRRPAGLARLLDGLRAIERPEGAELFVVVVDNDPEESAAAVADAARIASAWPLRYLRETRRGVSFARNAALAAASDADFIAFVDDDEVPGTAWLVELVARQRASGAAAVCGLTLPQFEPGAASWLEAAFRLCYMQPRSDRPLTELATGNLLLDRRALERHGLRFDEALSLIGGEDTMLGRELVERGEQIAWAERAVVHEFVPASRMRLAWLLGRWYRTGNIETILAMRGRRGVSGRCRGLIGGLARIGLGGAALVLALPRLLTGARPPVLRRLYTVCRGLGMVASVFGRHRNEYRTTHGA